MHVVVAPRLLHGAEHVVFNNRIATAVRPPGVARAAVRALAEVLGTTQADADVIAPAEPGRQAEDLLLIAAVAVQEDQQRVGVVRLVAGGEKGAHGEAAGGLYFRRVKALGRTKQTPGETGVRHGGTYRARGNRFTDGRGHVTEQPRMRM